MVGGYLDNRRWGTKNVPRNNDLNGASTTPRPTGRMVSFDTGGRRTRCRRKLERVAIGVKEIHLHQFATIRKFVGVLTSRNLGEDFHSNASRLAFIAM